MTSTKPAGPELDAELAEAMGCKPVRIPEPSWAANYYTCPCVGETEFDRLHGESNQRLAHEIHAYSTDISAAISAAEEARKAGRIATWDLFVDSDCVNAGCGRPDGNEMVRLGRIGTSPAHALTLALLSALKEPA